MRLIFCSDPLNERKHDPIYEPEISVAKTLDLETSLLSYETLVNANDPQRAIRRISEANTPVLGIYRGWMLKPRQYEQLYTALLEKQIRLINDPAAYRFCHYLPESYSVIAPYTPQSTYLWAADGLDLDRIMEALQPFGTAPIVLKDFVKSQKHYWHEAFYIPSASDKEGVGRVVARFLELQGDDLNEGLVFRKFVELEPLGSHSKSGMPLTREYRLFFLDGKLIYSTEYWSDAEYGGDPPPTEHFIEVAKAIKSRFFTMDIAKQVNGAWIIVELGDGQVAGLPDNADVMAFYSAMKDAAS
ncbi:MAG: ATP-grasp domain-containing protein [Chloroflexota bacterium]